MNLYFKCNKLDPFGYRDGKMEKQYVFRLSYEDETTYEFTDDQYYKIELLRIRMLNHIATCDHSQCQLVFRGHYDDCDNAKE